MCRHVRSGPSIGRVVVVGGGYGGATAARYLKLWGGNVDVTLVERNTDFVSCPISNLVLGGHKQMADITRGYDGLKAVGVKVVQGEVTAIDVAGKKLRLAGGGELPYDRLVLSPGVDFMADQIGGLQPALDSGRVLHSWKAGPQTVALRRQIEAMPDGGVFAMFIPKAPYRCPPGPYERACVVASYLKTAKPQSKVLVLDANPEITSKKGLFEKAFKDHYAGIIEYRPNAELKEVSRQRCQARVRGRQGRRAQRDPAAARRRPGAQRRAPQHEQPLGRRQLADDGVHRRARHPRAGRRHLLGAGDAQVGPHGQPACQGGGGGDHPAAQGRGGQRHAGGDEHLLQLRHARDAMHVASVHQYDAADKTFKTVPGSGGVSAAASQIEGALRAELGRQHLGRFAGAVGLPTRFPSIG